MLGERGVVALPLNCQLMPEIRHVAVAPTRTRRLGPGASVSAHRHDDHQIVYAGRGVLTVETGAGSWVAPATRAIWIPAGTVHAHRAHRAADLHTIGLPAGDGPPLSDRPAVLNVAPLLRELILAYTRPPHDDTPARGRLRAVLVDQLHDQLHDQFLDQLPASPHQPLHLPLPREPRLAAVCALLRADPGDQRTLAALGRATGAGERTLSRLFGAELGMTFPQWRTQLRLHHALLLLADGVPVSTVARRCGWASASAFIDVFRRMFGHTPGAHLRGEGAPDQRIRTGE
jgi:AraC-like DNA-binding protein